MQRQRQEPTEKQWKEKMQRAYERGIKQISIIDIPSKETRKQEGKQASKQTKGGVREGQMYVWIKCP